MEVDLQSHVTSVELLLSRRLVVRSKDESGIENEDVVVELR
jgi:hypothetical protein